MSQQCTTETWPEESSPETIPGSMSGILYCGDNLEILQEYVSQESVDLVYLDPPFNSKRTYNIVYEGSVAQDEAFKDYWGWEEAAASFATLSKSVEVPRTLRTVLNGLHDLLIESDSDLLAYLTMMTPRLLALHRVLKSTGSLYLHCDPTASHYIKLILDSVFGEGHFQNEIIWRRTLSKGLTTRRLPSNHDTILVYRKGAEATWNGDFAFIPYKEDELDEKTSGKYCHTDEDGRIYRLSDVTNPNHDRPNLTYEFLGVTRVWRWTKDRMMEAYREGLVIQTKPGTVPQLKRYLDEQRGRPLDDVWVDIPPLNSQAKERIGYPTQKPMTLLDRILRLSSKPGDLVLDPFCGCGTTIESCERLGRRWIGVDLASKAVEVIEGRFAKVNLDEPEVVWHPVDLAAAEALAVRNPKQFEVWALRKIRATRRQKKDRGIDGESLFRETDGKSWRVLVSVKSGKSLNPAMVRELRGTIEREKAPIGVFLCMHEPSSKEIKLEASRADFLPVSDSKGPIPKIQILTIEQIFAGEVVRCPGLNVTQMPAPSVPTGKPQQLSLNLKTPTPAPPKGLRKTVSKPPVLEIVSLKSEKKSSRQGR